MDTENNITAQVSVATIDLIDEAIDKKGGIIAKAVALRHLTSILASDFEHQLGSGKGKPGQSDVFQVFTVHKHALENMSWVVSEVHEISRDLDDMIADLSSDFVEVSNAAYDAKNSTAPAQAGA
ncbi:MAG TPA: hypothetical protein VL147_01610 [Devosia sp.]|nr:hypothetical protein [Devosia sp.]